VQYNIRSIPNFAVFSGGQLQWQQAGLLNQQQMEQVLARWL
jgi:thioredoxin 2